LALDPTLGQLAFAPGREPASLRAVFATGFTMAMGGGPYDPYPETPASLDQTITWQIGVSRLHRPVAGEIVGSLPEAIALWNVQPPGTRGVICILDSQRYSGDLVGAGRVEIPAGSHLTLIAASWPAVETDPGVFERPVGTVSPGLLQPYLLGSLEIAGTAPADDDNPGAFTLQGLQIEQELRIAPGNLGQPALLPREGIHHHFARLALLSFDGTSWSVISDCRKLFPPITQPRDCNLKLHNKHLHGKGVVCGLAVHCGGADAVMVLPGHAIDCEGTDILVHSVTSVPVIAQAVEQGLLNPVGNGDVLLTLQAGTDESPVFGLRAAPEHPDDLKGVLEHILEGTLWWDFYHDCLKPLVDFLREKLVDDDSAASGALVSTQKTRLVTLANLLAHQRPLSPSRRLWLSLEQHALLKELYDGLVAFAGSSHTVCDGNREFPPFPAFPFETRPIKTAFAGRRLHGIKMTPDGRRALAWSQDEPGRLFVLDAETAVFLEAIDLPNAAASTVRDVTFPVTEAGPQVLVLATAGTTTQIHFLQATDLKPSQLPVQLAGGQLARAEMHPLRPTVLIAVEPGLGVHFFDLNKLDSGSMPQPEWNSSFTNSAPLQNALAVEAMIAFTQANKPKEWLESTRNQFARAKSFGRLGADKTIQELRKPAGTASARSGALNILEQPSERVVTDLSNAGIQVNRIADYQDLLAEGKPLPR